MANPRDLFFEFAASAGRFEPRRQSAPKPRLAITKGWALPLLERAEPPAKGEAHVTGRLI